MPKFFGRISHEHNWIVVASALSISVPLRQREHGPKTRRVLTQDRSMYLFLVISETSGLKGKMINIEKSISDQENTAAIFQVKLVIALPSRKWRWRCNPSLSVARGGLRTDTLRWRIQRSTACRTDETFHLGISIYVITSFVPSSG